jgi:hypothetical protein
VGQLIFRDPLSARMPGGVEHDEGTNETESQLQIQRTRHRQGMFGITSVIVTIRIQ